MDIVKDLERAVELRPRASRKLPQGPELVERRLAAALGLSGVQGLVVEAVLHAHAVAFLEGQAEKVDLFSCVAIPLLWCEPVKSEHNLFPIAIPNKNRIIFIVSQGKPTLREAFRHSLVSLRMKDHPR